MLNIYPLYSSSSGNVFCVELDDKNILIDCGVTCLSISKALNSINKKLEDISDIYITHEHIDHIKGFNILYKKSKHITFHATSKTATYLENRLIENGIEIDNEIEKLEYDKEYSLFDNKVKITPFEISHDAIMPCGYFIEFDSKSVAFATDLGFVSKKIMSYLKSADYIVLESNYDKIMLEYGPYPYSTKLRISSDSGHLSNDDTANIILDLVKEGKTNFILAHMSTTNNNTYTANETISTLLSENNIPIDSVNINFATKTPNCEVFGVC